jgi:hypothetical protein
MSTKSFEAFLREFVAKAGSSILLPTFNQGGQQYLYSYLAPVASSARDFNPLLIAKVLSRGLNAYFMISVHLSGLDLLARSLNSGRVLSLTENGARYQSK